MKKILCILLSVFITFFFAGCGKGNNAPVQKTEAELKAEIQAEMEAEAKNEEELRAQIKAELEAEQKANENNKNDTVSENNTEILPQNNSGGNGNPIESNPSSSKSSSTYFQYKANETIYFDMNRDGTDEEILYDSNSGKLVVTGFDAIDLETMFLEKEYFIIIKFNDKYDNVMHMIGILNNGPSMDIVTDLYSIIAPMGEDTFVHVGSVQGEIVTPSNYHEPSISSDSMDDFNYKAVLLEGEGIEAPVRLAVLNNLQTWFGRNLFTYYTTYCRLIDNIEKYEQDYTTFLPLTVLCDVNTYTTKDKNSDAVTLKGNQSVVFLSTDNHEWIGFEAADGTNGWIHIDEVTEQNFSGFTVFD